MSHHKEFGKALFLNAGVYSKQGISHIAFFFFRFGSERSEFDMRKMYCMYEDEHVDQFSLGPKEYLSQLVPPTEEVQATTPGLPAHLMSRSALISLPLHDRVKTVMINGMFMRIYQDNLLIMESYQVIFSFSGP